MFATGLVVLIVSTILSKFSDRDGWVLFCGTGIIISFIMMLISVIMFLWKVLP